jgi:hypothetical protein
MPSVERIDTATEYDHTYSVNLDVHHELGAKAAGFAEGLRAVEPSDGAYLLCGLLDAEITRGALHVALAAIRTTICDSTNSAQAAVHARLGDVGDDAGAFLLHADLYVPEMLLLIYDDVPEDGSGELLLLPRARFLALLGEHDVPPHLRRRLASFLLDVGDCDRFAAFYGELYRQRPWERWRDALVADMHDQADRIALRRGEGVILNDRRWLHGRSKPSRGVSPWRLHRLAFTSVDRT